jgi:Fur family ferric uptake transcriptional regulator
MKLPKDKRLTRQRKVILEALRSVKTHPAADEVYDMVRQELPKISLGTVYRNLEVLSEMGFIQKLEMAGLQKRFDGNPEPHYHIRCLNCGCVRDVDVEMKLDMMKKNMSGFLVQGYRLEFVGVCPDCQAGVE